MNKNLKKVFFATTVIILIIGIVLITKAGKFEKLEGYMYSLAAEITGTATSSDATSSDATSSNATSSNATSSNATSSNAAPKSSATQAPKASATPTPTPTLTPTPTPEPTPEPEEEEKISEKFDFYSSEITPTIVSTIIAGESDVTITLDGTKNISKSLFDALKGTSRTLTIKTGDNEIIFKGKEIKEGKNIDASISISEVEDDIDLKELVKNGIVLSFADNGELPGEATIRIKVTNQIKDKLDLTKDLYIYFYNEENKKLEKIDEKVKYEKDYIEFVINHNSKFVLVDEEVTEKENEITIGTTEEKDDKEEKEEDVTFLESNKMYVIIIGAAILIIFIVSIIVVIVNKKKKQNEQSNEINESEEKTEEINEEDKE